MGQDLLEVVLLFSSVRAWGKVKLNPGLRIAYSKATTAIMPNEISLVCEYADLTNLLIIFQ